MGISKVPKFVRKRCQVYFWGKGVGKGVRFISGAGMLVRDGGGSENKPDTISDTKLTTAISP